MKPYSNKIIYNECQIQETSYTTNVIDKDDHIQELNVEEVSYIRTIVYKEDQTQRMPYSNKKNSEKMLARTWPKIKNFS